MEEIPMYGRPKTRIELAHELGISYWTMERRIKEAGLDIPKYCLLTPPHQLAIRKVVLGLDDED